MCVRRIRQAILAEHPLNPVPPVGNSPGFHRIPAFPAPFLEIPENGPPQLNVSNTLPPIIEYFPSVLLASSCQNASQHIFTYISNAVQPWQFLETWKGGADLRVRLPTRIPLQIVPILMKAARGPCWTWIHVWIHV